MIHQYKFIIKMSFKTSIIASMTDHVTSYARGQCPKGEYSTGGQGSCDKVWKEQNHWLNWMLCVFMTPAAIQCAAGKANDQVSSTVETACVAVSARETRKAHVVCMFCASSQSYICWPHATLGLCMRYIYTCTCWRNVYMPQVISDGCLV